MSQKPHTSPKIFLISFTSSQQKQVNIESSTNDKHPKEFPFAAFLCLFVQFQVLLLGFSIQFSLAFQFQFLLLISMNSKGKSFRLCSKKRYHLTTASLLTS
ncbi:hypothetical protein ACKWTF_000680 [Chironomus riparius]